MKIDEIVKSGCGELNIPLPDLACERFEKYAEILKEWNEKMNLTAITEDEEIAIKHFLDSASAICTERVGKSVIDVGTGAGFPGMVLKILRPETELTLLDSLNKRINFLNETAKYLDFDDIKTVHGRAEDFGKKADFREKYDTAVSRAVAKLRVLAEYCLPFVKVGGYFLALKGPVAEEELKEAKKSISILGGEVENVLNAKIPHSSLSHKIIVIKKVRHTPMKYPRKPALISNLPIEQCYNVSKNAVK